MGDVVAWCEENCSGKGPDDSFVIDFWHSNIEDPRADFHYVISTPSLLENATKMRVISCDETYKLNIHDYPVVVIAGIDAVQKMHLIAFAVTTREEGKNFEFIFTAIKKNIRKLHQIDYKPEVLVSDAAGAIRNGFFAAFPELENAKHVTCWFHVLKAAKAKIDKAHRSEAVNDLHAIHMSSSEAMFKTAVALFEVKWVEILPDFCQYFKKYWVDQHSNWYEGYVDKCPATNSGIEGFNSYLKKKSDASTAFAIRRI